MATESQTPHWVEFASWHEGHPMLGIDPLYSLTPETLDAIRVGVPGLFEPADWRFESELASAAPAGFFLKRPIGDRASPLLAELPDDETAYAIARHNRLPSEQGKAVPSLTAVWAEPEPAVVDRIKDLNLVMMEAVGRGRDGVAFAREQSHVERVRITDRHEAYAGWLVTNREFLGEVAALRQDCDGPVRERGGLPRRIGGAVCWPGETRPAVGAAAGRFLEFYRRWGMEGLLTWDVPLPRRESVGTCWEAGPRDVAEGVVVNLPWHLVRGGQIDVQDIVCRLRFESTPDHLREWVLAEERAEKLGGEIACQQTFAVYWIFELVLGRRYAERCRGRTELLDEAVGGVLGRSGELVRKLRHRLSRRRSVLS